MTKEFLYGALFVIVYQLFDYIFIRKIFFNPKKYKYDCLKCKQWDCPHKFCEAKRRKLEDANNT